MASSRVGEGLLRDDAHKRERFEALVRPELDALFRVVARIVASRPAAEEISQDACLKAFANFDPVAEPVAFRGWLFRIAVNQALDYLRRKRREAPLTAPNDHATQWVADGSLAGHPHALVEGSEIGRALETALAAMAPDLRAVAALVLVEEMSYAETAVALSISEDLVRSRLSRARSELRGRLAPHGADLTPRYAATPSATRRGTS